ncbi:MAG: GNAT family N-acetyltransferase [Bacillota bacterium]|nr:GNAT family N-acetyltransferase [Bacillota bacterium]
MRLERLNEEHAKPFRDLRLQAFQHAPEAFGSSYEEEIKLSQDRLVQKYPALFGSAEDTFILGAFDDAGRLIGVAGFYREPRIKNRHKGVIWGMYIVPECRHQGVARSLLQAILERARKLKDMRQINLVVTSGNASAKTLYLSMGFQVFGVEKDALQVDNQFYDEDFMVLRLET